MTETENRFRVRLAGKVFGVTCLYENTRRFCKGYLTDAAPDFSVTVMQDDIDQERARTGSTAEDRRLEPIALHRKICTLAAGAGVMMIHGAAIAENGKAHLFIAPSGTGKTTHIRLWKENFPGISWINGDKPMITVADGVAFAHGTPWAGKERYQTDTAAPLDAIVLLRRGETNRIRRITAAEALPGVYAAVYRPDDRAAAEAVVRLFEKLMRAAPCYVLECNMDKEAALVAREGLHAD